MSDSGGITISRHKKLLCNQNHPVTRLVNTSMNAHVFNQNSGKMDSKSLVKLAKSLSDPTRLALLQEIAKGTNRGCADLFEFVPISQPSMSQHLKALSDAGLIESRKEGRNMKVAIIEEKLQELEDFLRSLH